MTVEVSARDFSRDIIPDAYMPHKKTYYSLETMKPFTHGQSIWYEGWLELSPSGQCEIAIGKL